MPNPQYSARYLGPPRNTAEKAEADYYRILDVVSEHAPELVGTVLPPAPFANGRPVPGAAACNAKSRG